MALSVLGQEGSRESHDLKPAAYDALSAFLQVQLDGKTSWDDIRVGQPGSVIAPTTMRWKTPIALDERSWMKRELKGLEDDTLDAFERCATTSLAVTPKFSLSVSYKIASPDEISSVEKLYATYPKTWGYIRVSCVAFNASESQALFFLEREMCRCAVGKFVLMKKDASGKWLIAGQMVRWIS